MADIEPPTLPPPRSNEELVRLASEMLAAGASEPQGARLRVRSADVVREILRRVDGGAKSLELDDALLQSLRLAHANDNLAEQQSASTDAALHDVRSPLSTLTANSPVLANAMSGTPHEDQARKVVQASEALQMLFDAMVASRPGAQPRSVESEAMTFDLATQLIDITVNLQRDLTHNVGVQLVSNVQPVEVTLHRQHIWRIVDNLVGNAVKHALPTRVVIDAEVTSNEVAIFISDDGKGIPPGAIERAQLYARMPHLRKGSAPGQGLSSAFRLSELVGGSLTVTIGSGKPTGTRWCLRVPQFKRREFAVADSDLLAGRFIIVLDDDRAKALDIATRFEKLGAETDIVTNELDLLIAVQTARTPPHLLILDLVLSEEDRVLNRAVKLLRHTREALDNAVIATGHPGHHALLDVRDQVAAVIAKPMRDADFVGLCDFLTGKSTTLRKALGRTMAR
jgi:signal transduction histidine kinase